MKSLKTVALLLIIVPFISTAQNGGQYSQNSVGKLEYVGYSSGHYLVQQTNLQTCAANYKLTWLNKDTVINIAGNTAAMIQLPGTAVANTIIKSKPLDACSPGADMGWLEITSPTSLPATFKSIKAESMGNRKVKVTFTVADIIGNNNYKIQISTDGKTYKDIVIDKWLINYNGLNSVIIQL